MYKVFCDNQMIVDSRIDDLAIINPVVDIGVNMAGSFAFTFPKTHPKIDSVNRLTSVVRVERDDEIVFQGFCSSEDMDMFGNRKITCEGDLSYLNDSVLRPARYQGVTVVELLSAYISQHNAQVEQRKQFEVGIVTVQDPNDYIYCYTNMDSTMSQIKEDLIDDLGGYIRVRYENGHRYIDYLAEATRNAGQTIELGKNLINYNSNIDESNLTTRVIPLGALLENQVIEGLDTRLDIKSVNSGVDYLESASAVANFGIITKTVVFNDVNTASVLKTKGQAWLNDNQFENIVISATALDLGIVTDRVDTFKLMDRVHIISDIHGMDRWFMLPRITLNLNNPENDVYSFGVTQRLSLTAKTVKTTTKTEKFENSVNEGNWLVKAKKEATDLISGVDGGYVVMNVNEDGEPFEILIMDTKDKETATKVWRWNQNGLAYMPNGYHGSISTAITMNGEIIADFIKAGTIRSIEIANGGTSESNAPFKVTNAGAVTASDITITGGELKINDEYFHVKRNGIFSMNVPVSYAVGPPMSVKQTLGQEVFLFYIYGDETSWLYSSNGGQSTRVTVSVNPSSGKITANKVVAGSFEDANRGFAMCGNDTGHTYHVHWNGSQLEFQVDTTWVWSSSDKRLKKNIEEIKNSYINAIGKVDLIQYNQDRELYDDKILYFGAIVQDIIEALEEEGLTEDNLKLISKNKISDEDDTEYYGLDYEQFLLARIAYDEKRIADLEQRLADLEGRIK